MKHFVTLAFFVVSVSLTGQARRHALKVEKCQADQQKWLSQLEDDNARAAPDYVTEFEERKEMAACEEVDPDNRARYYNTVAEIGFDESTRMGDFIQRHGLWKQFIEEDKAGMRPRR